MKVAKSNCYTYRGYDVFKVLDDRDYWTGELVIRYDGKEVKRVKTSITETLAKTCHKLEGIIENL